MPETRPRTYYPLNRVEGYTDAVFAIAATLLVLDLTTSALGEINSDTDMWAAMGRLVPNLGAFALSFVLLSGLWVIHLRQFRDIARVNGLLLWLNNGRLLFIVLIPFSTSVTSDYQAYYAGRMLLPVNFFFAALLGTLCWTAASAHEGQLLREEARADRREQGMGGVSAVICGAVAALLSPLVGSAGFLAYLFNGPLQQLLVRLLIRRKPSALRDRIDTAT